MPKKMLVHDHHADALGRISKATGKKPHEVFGDMMEAAHKEVFGVGLPGGDDAGGTDARPFSHDPKKLEALAERMGENHPAAEKKALERLGPPVDPDTDEVPESASSSASASDDDSDGASTSDAPVHSPLKRWAKGSKK